MKKIMLLILILGSIGPGYAQDDYDELLDMSLEELMQMELSVGSKTIKNPDQIPGAVTVIDKEQIRAMQARTLRDVLNVMVPSMDVVPTYFKFGNPVSEGIYSRGILSDFNQQILILYNGESKFNESTFGSPYTGMRFTLENVERIEISTSPAPLLGASALTTINIITKETNLTGTEIYVNSGFSDGLQSKRFTVNHGQYIDTWHLGASVQFLEDDGQAHPDQDQFGVFSQDAGLKDGIKEAVSFTFNLKSPNEKLEVGSWYKNVIADALFSSLSISESSDLYNYGTSVFHNYVKYTPINSLEISAGASSFRNTNTFNLNEFIPIGVNQRVNVPFSTSIKNYNSYVKLDYLKDFEFMGGHTLNVGAKVEREGQSDHVLRQLGDDNSFSDVTEQRKRDFGIDFPDDDRTVYSLYGENNWNVSDDLSLLLGFRVDNYQNFGGSSITAFNPRVALAYLPTKNLILKALYSTAIRPPSLYEIEGSNFLPQLYGNLNLTFEKLSAFEISAKYRNGGFEITANPYYEIFKDRINYITSELDVTAKVASNTGELQILGIEVNTRYSWNKLNYVFLNASRFRSENQVTGERSPYIPEVYLNGGVNFGWDKLNANLTAIYRGERKVEANMPINADRATDSHFITNLALTYLFKDGVEVYVLTENLMDGKNFVPLSRDGLYVPLRGRTVNIGFNLKF